MVTLADPLEVVDHRSTYKHFERVLSRGAGVNLKTFDNGIKPRWDFFTEIQKCQVALRYNRTTKRAERRATSVKIIVVDRKNSRVWREVGRRYKSESGSVIHEKFPDRHTAQGTLLRGEEPYYGAIRETWEELEKLLVKIGLTIFDILLLRPSDFPWITGLPDIEEDEHESTVFQGVLSIVTVYWFIWVVDDFYPNEDELETEDTSKVVRIRACPLHTPQEGEYPPP